MGQRFMKKRISLLTIMLCSLLAPVHIQAMRVYECDDSDDEIMAALDEARITAQPLSPDEVTTLFSRGTNYSHAAQTNASRTGGYVNDSGIVVSGLQSASRNNRQLHYMGQVNGMVSIGRLMQPIMPSARDTSWQQLTWAQDPYRYKELPTSPMTAIERSELKTLTDNFDIQSDQAFATNRILLAKALDENCDQAFINKILEKAAYRYDYYLMKKALEHGADPDIEDRGESILLRAKLLDNIKLLVSKGASMKKVTSYFKNTVLHQACHEKCEPAVLEYYIQNAGLDINSENAFRETPLHILSKSLNYDKISDALIKLKLLLIAGADCMRKDHKQKTALDKLRSLAAQSERNYAALQAYESFAAQLNAVHEAQKAKIIAERQAKMEKQLSCIICTDEFELDPSLDTITLPCAHIFHTTCIGVWFKTIQNCPVCRTPIE